MTPAERLRAHGERVARAMELDPAGVHARVHRMALPGCPPWWAHAQCGAVGGDVFVSRRGYTTAAFGHTAEAAVDAAIAALSARLSSRAREAVDEARRAVEVSEWWQRVSEGVTR